MQPLLTRSGHEHVLRRFALTVAFLMAVVLAGCTSLPTDVNRPVSQALQEPQDTALGQQFSGYAAAIGARYDSGFRLLGGTEAAYTSRLALVDAAQKTLDLQYYAILVDQSTEQFVWRLREAAARGVRIRILLDDFNTTGANAQFLRLAFEPNIEMRLFNPLPGSRNSMLGRLIGSLGHIEQAQRRMHNKMFIADNAVGITGGRNLGDAYFGQNTDSNFIDLDVLAAGSIVRRMSASFDAYWNNDLAYPVQSLLTPDELDALRPHPKSDLPRAAPQIKAEVQASPLDLSPARLTWAPSLLLVDHADKIAAEEVGAEDTVVDGLLRLMERTQRDLFIVSPYFVPGDAMMATFAKLRQAGVNIRVLTNSLAATDAPLAHVGYARYRKRLLAMGVELYEMRADPRGGSSAMSIGSAMASRASLHAKTLVFDEHLLVVGSMNLDMRSQLQNSEIALLLRSATLAHQALEMAAPVLHENAYRLSLDDGQLVWHTPDGSVIRGPGEPDAGTGLQLMLKLIGPFAPDALL